MVGAIRSAAATVPAFIRVQDDWGLAFFRVGNKDISLADLHAVVAASTGLGLKITGLAGVIILGNAYVSLRGMTVLPISLIDSGIVPVVGFIVSFHIAPIVQR